MENNGLKKNRGEESRKGPSGPGARARSKAGMSAALPDEWQRFAVIRDRVQEVKIRTGLILEQLYEGKRQSAGFAKEFQQGQKRAVEFEQAVGGWKALGKRLAQVEKALGEQGRLLQRLPKAIYYHNDYERRVIGSFHAMRKREDFPQKFLALVRGLDPASRGTVARILRRQQMIEGTDGKEVDLFTAEEQAQIAAMEADFKVNVFQVSDHLYAYRNYLLPIHHFEPSVFRERHGLALVEDPGRVREKDIVDVGGYIGDSALILAPMTDKNIHVFESASANFDLLQETIRLNGLRNVVPVKKALGSKAGSMSMNISGACSSLNMPNTTVTHQESVEVVPLDDYVRENGLSVGLIKVDIEGYEQEFLRGAEQTIRTQRPVLLLSIYHNAGDFFDIKPLLESWDLGYRFKVHKPVDHSVSREVLLIAERPLSGAPAGKD